MSTLIFHLQYPDFEARMRAMAQQFARWMATVDCHLEIQR
jgi:hypothetical protein